MSPKSPKSSRPIQPLTRGVPNNPTPEPLRFHPTTTCPALENIVQEARDVATDGLKARTHGFIVIDLVSSFTHAINRLGTSGYSDEERDRRLQALFS